jgi:RNA polymerase sigma-70 factor, ECF subfamily
VAHPSAKFVDGFGNLNHYSRVNPELGAQFMGGDPAGRPNITEMLKAWSGGDRDAAEDLMPLVYGELRQQARRYLRRERENHTLQTTGLVHEAYLRLVDQHAVTWQNRAHFFGIASQMMRRILVNYAVGRSRDNRGGGAIQITLDDATIGSCNETDEQLIALDQALARLESLDERQVRIVEMRYFTGLSIGETAEVLGISPATVKREWNMARAWLRSELE